MIFTQKHLVALSILFGCCLVALAIVLSGFSLQNVFASFSKNTIPVQRIDALQRHIYGNAHAPVTIVEFADLECPYCSQLHVTLKKVVDESNGSINWEFRQFPLSIHQYAHEAALTSECVATLQGSSSFWNFVDTIMTHQALLNSSYLSNIAAENKIDVTKLKACMADKKTIAAVDADAKTALLLGGTGTPFSVIIYADKTTKAVSGALPYAQWKSLLHMK